jgi:hypothetical protein
MSLCLGSATVCAGDISILSPRTGETVVDSRDTLPVTLKSNLAQGERVRILVNGIAVKPYGSGDRIVLAHVDLGQSTLEAQVVDEHGSVVATSGPVTFSFKGALALPREGAPLVPEPGK